MKWICQTLLKYPFLLLFLAFLTLLFSSLAFNKLIRLWTTLKNENPSKKKRKRNQWLGKTNSTKKKDLSWNFVYFFSFLTLFVVVFFVVFFYNNNGKTATGQNPSLIKKSLLIKKRNKFNIKILKTFNFNVKLKQSNIRSGFYDVHSNPIQCLKFKNLKKNL